MEGRAPKAEGGKKLNLDSANTSIQTAKAVLRREVRQRLKGLDPSHRATAAAQACALLERQESWRSAGSVLFYAATATELNIWPLLNRALAAGKMVALPRFETNSGLYSACQVIDLEQDLTPGQFGIHEPAHRCARIPLNRLDFILTPGIAFDSQGRRLGRGKGFYDRLLMAVCGMTCGVAFDEQIVDAIPVEPHDRRLNCILTPTRWVELCGRAV